MTERELLTRLGIKNKLPLLSDVLGEYFTAAGMPDAAKRVCEVLDDYIMCDEDDDV